MFFKIHIMIVSLLITGYASAQTELITDSSTRSVNYFKDHIKERYNSSAFDYSSNDTGGMNLLELGFSKFFRWMRDVFGFDIDVNYKTLEYIVYALLGLLVLYLLIKFLLRAPIQSLFKSESKTIDSIHFTEESLEETNFDKLIKKALKKDNFRLATRFHFLKSLQLLSKYEYINWNFDKTNSEYINEIQQPPTKQLFRQVAYVYDYVWYGEFPIDQERYDHNTALFNKLYYTVDNG